MWEVFGYLRASYEYSEIENFVWLSFKLKEKWEKKSCVFIFKLFSVVCLVKELDGYFKKCVLNYSHSRTEYKYNPKGKKAINIRSQGSQLYQRDFFPKLEVRWNLPGKIMIFESKFAKRKDSNERGKIRALRWAYMVDNWLTMACKLVVIKAIGKLGTTSGRSYLYIEDLQRGLTTLSYEWWNEIYETWAWVLIAWL